MAKVVGVLSAALLGGAVGGALVGTAEAILVAVSSGSTRELWVFWFAVLWYGLLGAGVGGACGAAWAALRRRTSTAGAAAVAGLAAAALPGLIIVRYHVAKRVFHEALPLFTPTGLAVHALIALAAAVFGAVVAFGVHRLARRHAALLAAALGVLGLGAWALGIATDRSGPVPVDRRASLPGAQDRPNVVLIVADTLRADALEPWGAPEGTSPATARMASESVLFSRAYAQASWTRPSVATILTGQYPSQHGATHKMSILPDKTYTLAEALRSEGYWTAAFTTNINVTPVFNFQQGFDEFTYLEPAFYFGATESATGLSAYKLLRLVRERWFADRIYFQHYYQDAEVVNRAVHAWLEQNPPEPFFLFIHYMDPHDPYFEIPYNGHGVARVNDPDPAPERAAELRELYLQDVRYLDDHLGPLWERLRALGLLERSVVVFTADHGEEFQEHGGWWHGTTLYEEAIHVPLLIHRPREPWAGRKVPAVVRTVDIVPTILNAVGAEVPPTVAGRDLFGPDSENDPILYAEEDLEGNRLAAIRIGRWKLIEANPDNPRGLQPIELYDLEADPGETRNLAGEEKRKVAELRARLESFRDEIGAHW